jgi:hypothetical protein
MLLVLSPARGICGRGVPCTQWLLPEVHNRGDECSMLSTGLGADPPTYPNLVPMTRVVDKHELRTSIYIC